VAALALAWFVRQFAAHLGAVPRPELSWTVAAALAASVLAYVILTLVDGAAWVLLLRGCGAPLGLRDGLLVFCIAQFGKYVPGNVAQHLGRVWLAREHGVPAAPVVFTIAVETLTAVLVGLLLIAVSLASMPDPADAALRWRMLAFAAPAVAGVAVLLHLLNRYRPWPLRRLLGDQPFPLPGSGAFALYVASHAASFLLMSVATDLVARFVFGVADPHFALLPGVLAMGWVSGFVVPGAPAGLGVREAVLLAGLGPLLGPGPAAGVTLATRLLGSVADALLFGGGLLARGLWARPKCIEGSP